MSDIDAIVYRTPACDAHLDQNDSDECPWCRIERLLGFADSILRGWPEAEGEMMDGLDIQERGEKYGLLIPTEVTEPCGEWCNCVEYGDFPMTCYRLHPDIAALDNNDE